MSTERGSSELASIPAGAIGPGQQGARPGSPPGSRFGSGLAFALLVIGLGVSLFFSVHAWYDPTNDGSMYLLTARSLADGDGYTYLGQAFQIRPPGFSALIAPLVRLRGFDFGALNLFVSVWGAAGIVFLYLLLRRRLGVGLAWLVAATVWLNPSYQRLCNQPMSDVPGTTLLFLCLWMVAWLERRPTAGRNLLFGVAVGLAALVRSINLFVLPAVIVARLASPGFWRARADHAGRQPRWGALALLILGTVAVQLPWNIRNRVRAAAPPADQTLLYSYSSGMWNTDMGDPDSPRVSLAEVLGRFPDRIERMANVVGNRLAHNAQSAWPYVLAGVFLAATLYLALRWRRTEELFVLGAVLVMSFYFAFASRLMLPVYPLLLASGAEALRDLVNRVVPRGARSRRLSMGSGVAAVALGAIALADLRPRWEWEQIEATHRGFETVSSDFRERLGSDARLAAWRGWHYSVYLERPVYSLQFAVQRAGDVRGLEGVLDRYDLNSILFSPALNMDRESGIQRYLQARYGPLSGDARVYRVR